MSGRNRKNRPALEKAIDMLATGATSSSWRNGTERRSMFDGIAIIDRISKRGSLIKVLPTPVGRGFIAFLIAMA